MDFTPAILSLSAIYRGVCHTDWAFVRLNRTIYDANYSLRASGCDVNFVVYKLLIMVHDSAY